jgi:iron complex transport system substrate-binding protein
MFRRTSVALVLGFVLVGLVAFGLAACASDDSSANSTEASGVKVDPVTITDDAGRQVTIPSEIKSVFCTSPMGTNLMYVLAPDLMTGWNVTPTALEKEFIPEQYWNYVGLGGWYGKNTTGNVEEIIKRAPDVVLSIGYLEQSDIDDANRIQDLLNIPVVMVGGNLEQSGSALRYVGKLLGREDRAEELAAYCDQVISEAKVNAAMLAGGPKAKVYYAEGTKGLNTDAEGSEHTEVLELVGGQNVAQVGDQTEYGMAPVSLEQVLVWNPEVILVASDPKEESVAYDEITTGSQWKTITAVKDGNVYQIPRGPFDWFDRPPCIARVLGVRWLGSLLYPDLYQYDIEAEVRKFYELFYQIDLSQDQMDKLMGRSRPVGTTVTTAPAGGTTTTAAGETGSGAELEIKGLVESPKTFSVADLQAKAITIVAEHPKNGVTTYTGVLLSVLADEVGMQSQATTLVMTAGDGYMAEVPLADLSSGATVAIMDDGTFIAVLPGMEGKVWVSGLASLEFK